jgi:hypothetical protein
MKYVLMIYQGPTPTLPGSDRWKALSEAEQKAIFGPQHNVGRQHGYQSSEVAVARWAAKSPGSTSS